MTLSRIIRYNRQIYDTVLTDTQLDTLRSLLIQYPPTSYMADLIMHDLLETEGCFENYYIDAGENFLNALDAFKDDHTCPSLRIVEDPLSNYRLYFALLTDYMSMAFDSVDSVSLTLDCLFSLSPTTFLPLD